MLLKRLLIINSPKKLYIAISAIFIILLIFFSLIIQGNIINMEKEQVANDIYNISILLDNVMDSSFNQILDKYDASELSNDEKVKVINKELQPRVEKIAKIYDNYGIGYYSIDLDSVVAIAPNFKPSLLQRTPRSYPYFKSYETGKPEFVNSGTSIGWYGKSIYAITYPIYRNDQIIGHTWANYKMEDIYARAREQSKNIFLYGFIILIIVLLLTKLIIDLFKEQLQYISKSIALGEENELDKQMLPLIKPLVKKIKEEKAIITKQETELAKLERFYTIGEMAATLAHEVRNPLTTIDGYVQLMKVKTKDDYSRSKLDVISKEVVRVNSIVSEYLTFAREKKIKKELQNLNNIIESMYPLLQSDANKNRKTVILELDQISYLELNDKEIRQLIFNISRNGLEAMDEGGTLTIETFLEKGNTILSITDEGSGIPPEIIENIAKPFFTTKENGTGLGLSVCYGIVERHNGYIDIETSETGTTFKIVFIINDK